MTRRLGVGEIGRVRVVRNTSVTETNPGWTATALAGLGETGTGPVSLTRATAEEAEADLRARFAAAGANARRRRAGGTLTLGDWAHSWLALRSVPRAWRPAYGGALGGGGAVASCEDGIVEKVLLPTLGGLRGIIDVETEAHVVDQLWTIHQVGVALPALLGPTMGAFWAANGCRHLTGGPLRAFYDTHINDRWLPPTVVRSLVARLAASGRSPAPDLAAVAVAVMATQAPLEQVLATRPRDIDLQDPPHTLIIDEQLQETTPAAPIRPRSKRKMAPATPLAPVPRVVDLRLEECRSVALSASAATTLSDRLGHRPSVRPKLFVFSDDQDEPVSPRWIEARLTEAIKTAWGLEGITSNDLRSAAFLHLANSTDLDTAVAFATGGLNSLWPALPLSSATTSRPPPTWVDGLLPLT